MVTAAKIKLVNKQNKACFIMEKKKEIYGLESISPKYMKSKGLEVRKEFDKTKQWMTKTRRRVLEKSSQADGPLFQVKTLSLLLISCMLLPKLFKLSASSFEKSRGSGCGGIKINGPSGVSRPDLAHSRCSVHTSHTVSPHTRTQMLGGLRGRSKNLKPTNRECTQTPNADVCLHM